MALSQSWTSFQQNIISPIANTVAYSSHWLMTNLFNLRFTKAISKITDTKFIQLIPSADHWSFYHRDSIHWRTDYAQFTSGDLSHQIVGYADSSKIRDMRNLVAFKEDTAFTLPHHDYGIEISNYGVELNLQKIRRTRNVLHAITAFYDAFSALKIAVMFMPAGIFKDGLKYALGMITPVHAFFKPVFSSAASYCESALSTIKNHLYFAGRSSSFTFFGFSFDTSFEASFNPFYEYLTYFYGRYCDLFQRFEQLFGLEDDVFYDFAMTMPYLYGVVLFLHDRLSSIVTLYLISSLLALMMSSTLPFVAAAGWALYYVMTAAFFIQVSSFAAQSFVNLGAALWQGTLYNSLVSWNFLDSVNNAQIKKAQDARYEQANGVEKDQDMLFVNAKRYDESDMVWRRFAKNTTSNKNSLPIYVPSLTDRLLSWSANVVCDLAPLDRDRYISENILRAIPAVIKARNKNIEKTIQWNSVGGFLDGCFKRLVMTIGQAYMGTSFFRHGAIVALGDFNNNNVNTLNVTQPVLFCAENPNQVDLIAQMLNPQRAVKHKVS